ncbi:hypothetical protein RFI_12601 [Reticulomyxa filosa]|uniref:Uncharacterized protein n=1 Tax=Reticulomyxa filosa TaxID=46433 RepID=X6NEY0_RETFI|nr:hypothetical protein RFI_12601 [Reticulomyxa filosa]|eukprot:ETO24556.1 hypothetical protein RFI_12601 [Reticulomyxa filosa]
MSENDEMFLVWDKVKQKAEAVNGDWDMDKRFISEIAFQKQEDIKVINLSSNFVLSVKPCNSPKQIQKKKRKQNNNDK